MSSYTEQLGAWAESGACYPHLLLCEKDEAVLRLAQEALMDCFPGSEPADRLHATLFYLKPSELHEYLIGAGEPVDPTWLYMDLTQICGTLLFPRRNITVQTVCVERFGADGFVLGIQLGSHQIFADFQKLALMALRRNGVSEETLEAMREHPDYRWLVDGSVPHISLVRNVGAGPLEPPAIPPHITFDHLGLGSVSAPSEDPIRWYIMPPFEELLD